MHKDRFTDLETFPTFVQNTHTLYILRHCINIVLILQKNYFNLFTNQIIQLYKYPLIAPFDIFCQLDLQLGSESSTGNKQKRYQTKNYISVCDSILQTFVQSMQLPAQKEQVGDTIIVMSGF